MDAETVRWEGKSTKMECGDAGRPDTSGRQKPSAQQYLLVWDDKLLYIQGVTKKWHLYLFVTSYDRRGKSESRRHLGTPPLTSKGGVISDPKNFVADLFGENIDV